MVNKTYQREVVIENKDLLPYLEKKQEYIVRAKEYTKTVEANTEKLKQLNDELLKENEKAQKEVVKLAKRFNKSKKSNIKLINKIEKENQSAEFEVLEDITLKDGKITVILTDIKEKAAFDYLQAKKVK